MGREAYVPLAVHIDVHFLPTAYRAFSELWQRGRKDWAVDAFVPYMSYLLNYDQKSLDEIIDCLGGDIKAFLNGPRGVAPILSNKDAAVPDSMTLWMERYEQYTHEDLEHVGSYAAIDYWKLRGDYYLRKGDFDSAHYYYMKLDHPWNYVHIQGYERLMNLYNKFPERDPGYELRAKFDSKYVEGYMDVKKDRFLENEDEYRQRNVLINHELELEHERTLFVCGLLLLLGLICFAAYYLYKLRREHRETLEQNREYAEMLHTMRSQMNQGIIDTDIARRFHDLSSQDAHPTAEEWQALRNEIDRQHPQLFATLHRQYAEHQPDQTMTEQERHAVGLLVIRCSPLQMSVLLVCSKSNVSNLRRRLYTKLTGKDGSGTDLDNYIAAMCEL
jgi:DNA-binding CsgD family transcriptional regulator